MTILRETSNVITMSRRELQQRWAALAAAGAFGLVPVVAAAFWPSVQANARMVGVAEFLAAQAIAALMGLGLIGDDLASGRMGWYFSRPLSGFAIWAGKLGGAGALAIAATFVMTVPAMFLVRPREGLLVGTPLGAAGFIVCPLLFVGAGAVGGIIARARTGWRLLDLGCVVTFGPLVAWASQRIHAAAGGARSDFFGPAVLLVMTGALLAASAAGVMIGRADARRAHVAVSLTLWGILVPAEAALLGYVSTLPT